MFSFKSNIDALSARLENGARDAANETAKAIAQNAKARAPRDTGEMAEGITAIEDDDESGGLMSGSAEGIYQAGVDVPAPYAPYVHNGVGSRVAQPFLEEAAHEEESGFAARLGQIGQQLES